MTADLWSLLDQYTRIAAIAWWVWVVALAASAAITVTGAAWRIGRGIRRRAVRKADRHQAWVQGCDDGADATEWEEAA
jgi:hypothetical protein